MKLIIDIDDNIYKGLKEALNLRIVYMSRDDKERLLGAIKNGIPYEDKIEQITDLIETEWGYKGIREDVTRIMKGDAK